MLAASKNYSFASRFLPRAVLRHVEALYALMRVGDDRVDVTYAGFDSPLAAIADWERTYWQAFETGHSDHPIMRAYLASASACGIPAAVMAPYFRAMKEDLTVTRYPTFADLLHYMEGSALPVGRGNDLHSRSPTALHDRRDATLRRRPLDRHAAQQLLARHRAGLADRPGLFARLKIWRVSGSPRPTSRQHGSRLTSSRCWSSRSQRTEAYYRNARIAVRRLATGRVGVMAALEVYRGIHAAIRRNGYDVFTRRAGTTRLQKLGLALRAPLAVYLP